MWLIIKNYTLNHFRTPASEYSLLSFKQFFKITLYISSKNYIFNEFIVSLFNILPGMVSRTFFSKVV